MYQGEASQVLWKHTFEHLCTRIGIRSPRLTLMRDCCMIARTVLYFVSGSRKPPSHATPAPAPPPLPTSQPPCLHAAGPYNPPPVPPSSTLLPACYRTVLSPPPHPTVCCLTTTSMDEMNIPSAPLFLITIYCPYAAGPYNTRQSLVLPSHVYFSISDSRTPPDHAAPPLLSSNPCLITHHSNSTGSVLALQGSAGV